MNLVKVEKAPHINLMSTCHQNGLYSVYFKQEGDCIVCTSHKKDIDGYYRVRHVEKQRYLHRIIYSFYNNDLTDDLLVRHLCSNPNCCNPKHLGIGTQKDNMQDWVKAGCIRWNEERDNTKYGAILTNTEVIEIFLSIYPQRYLADKYNASPSIISRIKSRKHYAAVTEGLLGEH